MMHDLRDALENLIKDLVEEVKALYTDSINTSYNLYLKEKEDLEKQITQLQEKFAALNADTYTAKITEEYRELFGDMFDAHAELVSAFQ